LIWRSLHGVSAPSMRNHQGAGSSERRAASTASVRISRQTLWCLVLVAPGFSGGHPESSRHCLAHPVLQCPCVTATVHNQGMRLSMSYVPPVASWAGVALTCGPAKALDDAERWLFAEGFVMLAEIPFARRCRLLSAKALAQYLMRGVGPPASSIRSTSNGMHRKNPCSRCHPLKECSSA